MNVKRARSAARKWVNEYAKPVPGFRGALYHGSVTSLPDDAVLPATSDIDLMIVLDDEQPTLRTGKMLYHDVLLDVSVLPWGQCQSPDRVLSAYNLAGSFRSPGIIADPTGELTRVQQIVARDFAKRVRVEQRCAQARDKVLAYLGSLDATAPVHDQVTSLLFGTGVTTHVPLVAGLRNPTVRKRYLATRELLAGYGMSDFYETLLELAGFAQISPEQAAHHLDALAGAFDTARTVVRTPFFFASEFRPEIPPVAIAGSREMIEAGDHREAMFWIVATWARCQTIFQHDAPGLAAQYEAGFHALLADLGVSAFTDLQRRADRVEAALPQVWDVAQAIIAANPEIEG